MLKKFFRNIADFIIPPLCICCRIRIESSKEFFCKQCSSRLEKIDSAPYFDKKEDLINSVDHAFSLFKFSEDSCIQKAVHSLKYERMKSLGRLLGRFLGEEMIQYNLPGFDIIIPVPLHKTKLRERTFNQSEYIAFGIGEILRCRVDTNILERIRYTKSQTKLSSNERRENVNGAFMLREKNSNLIKNKSVLIVDDVITTGATILECVKSLGPAGYKSISVCSVAIA